MKPTIAMRGQCRHTILGWPKAVVTIEDAVARHDPIDGAALQARRGQLHGELHGSPSSDAPGNSQPMLPRPQVDSALVYGEDRAVVALRMRLASGSPR